MLHVLGCFVDDEPSCKLSRAEPERVAGLTVQLKLCMDPDSKKYINKQSNTSNNNIQYMEFSCYENFHKNFIIITRTTVFNIISSILVPLAIKYEFLWHTNVISCSII